MSDKTYFIAGKALDRDDRTVAYLSAVKSVKANDAIAAFEIMHHDLDGRCPKGSTLHITAFNRV